MLLSEGDDLTIATSDLQSKGHSFLTSPKHSVFFRQIRHFNCYSSKKNSVVRERTLATFGLENDYEYTFKFWRPFLESPETFRAHFGSHNSLCIFKAKESRDRKLCSYFNLYSFYNL